jgi:membrane protein YdbS with pleckstrin-like domain
MTVPQQKWIAGWPVASWFGFFGALCAVGVALWLWHSSSRVDRAALGVAAVCVTLAFANLRIAERT